MRFSRNLTVIVVLLAVSTVWSADDADKPAVKSAVSSLPVLPGPLHDALQANNFEQAVELIDAALKREKPPEPAYLLYLKGRAQTELGQLDQATATFKALEKQDPKGRWVSRSRFGRADVLVRQRNYRAAGDIYRAEAERLLSAGRRDELTGIYLEFADRYFEGVPAEDPSAAKIPDYQQSLTYYQGALKLKPSLKLQQRINLRVARCHQELKQYLQAIAAYQRFLKQYAADDTKAERRSPAKLEVQARYQLGRAQLAAGARAEARKTWQDFLAGEAAKAAGKDLLPEATSRLAHTYGIPAPATEGDLELGVAAHEKFLKQYPKHKLAAKAQYEIAQSYIHLGRHEQAVARLKALIGNPDYRGVIETAEARRLLGNSYLAQKKFTAAIAAWKEFLDKHPTHRGWSAVQRQVVDAEYQTASEQRRLKNYEAARKLWETFLNKYPLDARAAGILYLFGQMKYTAAVTQHVDEIQAAQDKAAQARKPGDEVRALFTGAIADWRRLLSKYPNTNEASQAGYMIGVTLEDRLGQLADALKAYKKVKGRYQSAAQKRIANLTDKQLELITERKFRTNEKPSIKLTTRNLEKVSVKLYRIDMADYFRKMHLAGGIETLDIALIDPDKSWDYAVEDYEQYRRLENEVEIPIDEPGVTAVTVSSEKLEVTTMVVVSNIDVVVKCSRNELFVFAEEMLTQRPAEGVSLLISDGKQVFAEEVTNGDGILQKSFKQLKTINDLRIFAVREGHAASTVSSLNGLNFAVGLSDKGYLFSDRPAYRAGQLVNLKGIVRRVENDRYTFKQGDKYRLDVYDARGRTIHTREVALNKFGAFAGNFMLPETAPQGQYRVHLHQTATKQSYETTFVVHEYKLEPLQLLVDLPQDVYFRGETVKGTITLKYYYGTPLAGRTIRYQLAGDRLHTAETNDKGEVEFEFPTRRYSESQVLSLVVQYPERNLQIGKSIYLATRGFEIGLSTLRSVYIAGETFDTTLKVSDPSGEPVGTNLKVEVLERTRVNGKSGEKLLETHEVTSDDKTGEVRQTLRIDKAGFYIIRATGTDRFGNPVSGSHAVAISGDEDKVRLRILADKHHYSVGDTAKVQFHWREEDALALVTYEGASILGYRLMPLKKGANPLEILLESKLAPNFVLSVTVMEGSKFHHAASEFRLTRKLNIVLKPDKATVKPGDELKVSITVTDPQGKPVSAEVSLGLVQKNLLKRFGDMQTVIDEFFGAGYRTRSLQVATSCTFNYRPKTRGISQYLLAEADRQRILSEEAEALASHTIRNLETLARFNTESWSAIPSFGTGLPQSSAATLGMVDLGGADASEVRKALDAILPGVVVNEDGRSSQLHLRGTPEQLEKVRAYLKMLSSPGSSEVSSLGGAGYRRGRLLTGEKTYGGFQYNRGFAGRAVDANASGEVANDFEPLMSMILPNTAGRWTKWGGTDEFGVNLSLVVRQSQSVATQSEVLLYDGISNTRSTIVALNGDGEFQVVNGLSIAALEDMAKAGFKILPKMAIAETGFWNPAIVTDKNGKATVTFRVPDRSTAWLLKSKGVDVRALAGQTEVEIVAKKDLFGDVKTPSAFNRGDKAQVLVEVHNSTLKKDAKIDVVLKITIGERSTELKKTVTSQGPGIEELTFPVEITEGESAKFELSVVSGDLSDTATVTIPIRPYGMPVFATASGSAAQNTIAFVEHDKALAVEDPSLEIVIGPSLNRTLLDAVLGSGFTPFQLSLILPRSGLERAISDLLGGVSLLGMVKKSATAEGPESQALAGRIQAAVSQMVSAQRDDGGWSWSGRPRASKSDRYLSSRAVWALAGARKAGFAVPNDTYNKGVKFLQSAYTASRQSDREGQAIILHGLAAADAGDFAFANRLYRERNNLSPSGLLHVALTLAYLDRKEMAKDLLDLVNLPIAMKRGVGNGERGAKDSLFRSAFRPPRSALDGVIPWMQSGVELRALYLLAIEAIQPTHEKAAPLADWLMAARCGPRWMPEKANGPAIAALAEWFSRTKHTDEKYTLSVFVNDRLVEKLKVDPSTDASRRIQVPKRMLVADKPQRINFDIEGRGRFSYSAVLGGFVPAEKLKSTTNSWRVTRTYEPAQRMLDGQVVPRGFGVLTGPYTGFQNELTQLPLGERGEVTLRLYRSGVRGTKDEQLDYLVVIEPIPAGTMVLTESIKGNYERYEISPGAITFYIGDRVNPGSLRYTLVGYLPGDYRTVPTVVRSFYRPDRIAVAKPKSLTVLARGEQSKDEYKLTPVELYEFGKRYLAKQQHARAAEHLTPLFREHRLNDKTYSEVVRMLFRSALAVVKNDAIVEYFEIIKEKYPQVEVDFASILKVAFAYRELGEYERSYLVYRATIEGSFQRESQIAGFLTARGEFLRSVQVLEGLLRDYPAESYVATATYALAQEVYGKGPEAAGDAKLREAKISRVDLIAASIGMLDHFISTWPTDPAADQASFSLATALLDLEQYENAIARCEKFAQRYPQSTLLDSYWYLIGYSRFALGQPQEALEMCKKVAETTRKDPDTGIEVPAANKWQAIYIMGQIYHSLSKPAEAIAEYERVKTRFSDALEAIDFFTRKEIKLPEVTAIQPDAAISVKLKFRNVKSANVKVYRIDLLKFGLMQRNLNRITAINLAGIRPYHELTLQLGDGKDFRDREQPLTLPLKDEGAYLVVCRGENLYTSGLVLISPLTLEIQEDAQSGRVRVTMKDKTAGKYAKDVQVRVIGSANGQFVSGETDLRGIFVADAIRGTSTVIARAGKDQYAFYRGKTVLGNVPKGGKSREGKPGEGKKSQTPSKPTSSRDALLENIINQNGIFNGFQRDNYRKLLNNKNPGGIKVDSAY